ncbi:hypothetical protein BGW38_001698 [Lunasporangiospora selenospora]|uniref:Peptidase inhibitor family I36 n=1 Tax=Lunasporangiospora selenospora TaxID=979761 RepID=A0A9P6FV79_9FUNG|nr:hypothetical protein BGW38_001698 [Lunasporangiospora selenospora]
MKFSIFLPIAALAALATTQAQEDLSDMSLVPLGNDTVNATSTAYYTVWASPGFKGHKQRNKNTRGCYTLDGGAVGSFEGWSKMYYTFYKESHCRGKVLYKSKTAPVKRIDPIIYPRSLKIMDRDDDDDDDPKPKYSLIAWSEKYYGGDKQAITGMGCRSLNGRTIRSIQGTYKYKFYQEGNCWGKNILSVQGPKSSVNKMWPRSVYIYK